MAFEGHKDQKQEKERAIAPWLMLAIPMVKFNIKWPLNSLFMAFLAFDLAFKDFDDGKGLNIT